MTGCVRQWLLVFAAVTGLCGGAAAQDLTGEQGLLEFHFTPTERTQLALWLEHADGRFVKTLRLTEATALRGIGNRPGASQMNSGFRWPYGRRDGVLPVWGSRRAADPEARLFKTVIFQDRRAEGLASRTSNDQSADAYYCLSFDGARARQDALDAVSCASPFNSDKGRFLTDADVGAGYGEPYEIPGAGAGTGRVQPLRLHSLYPPRHDVGGCGACNDHPDAAGFGEHVRDVMPDIDAVTMATPAGGASQKVLFALPAQWEPGEYRACLEVNTEGDHNGVFNQDVNPTPKTPRDQWDSWAINYGYPYRGQPSVVYCIEFSHPATGQQVLATSEPSGAVLSWDTVAEGYGAIDETMEGMSNDAAGAPGSGADRLLRVDGQERFRMVQQPALMCDEDAAPGPVAGLSVATHPSDRHQHEWAMLSFGAAGDDVGIYEYQVVVSDMPIAVDDDGMSFMRATRAKEATLEAAALQVPTDPAEGQPIRVELGGLNASTHYYVAVRAMDGCTAVGDIMVAEFTTPERVFTTVSRCVIATAAFGTPLAAEVGVLRRFRDRYLLNHAAGRVLVDGYYRFGPVLADAIADSARLRAAARWVLSPLIAVAELLDD